MALTRDHRETAQARARRDPAFRDSLLQEGVQCLLAGEVGVARVVLRDYINATVGFEQLGAMTGESPESLIQLFDLGGTPHADDLLEVLPQILQHEGVHLEVSAVREAQPAGAGAPALSSSSGRRLR